MKVLQVIPSVAERSGGPATAIVPMCRALQEQGVEVLLVTTNDGFAEKDSEGLTNYKGVPARVFPVQIGESFKYSRPLATWLHANVQHFDVIHIHAVFNHASVTAASACRRADVPYVVRPLGTLDPWSMRQKALRKHLFWWLSGKRMIQRSAAVHYTAQAEKQATESYLRLNHGRVIALGVEVSKATNQKNSVSPYVLVLSRLHPKKGLDLLIDAFLSLAIDPWRLVIAGEGERDYVAYLKAKAGNSERIVFTGWVDGEQKDALLSGASLLALPSRQENFGFSVMEAMACGVPVLLSPHVNLAQEIEQAKTGWIADLEKGALAKRLAEILRDEAEREKRGLAAQLFSQQYSWEKTVTGLTALYREVISHGATVHGI